MLRGSEPPELENTFMTRRSTLKGKHGKQAEDDSPTTAAPDLVGETLVSDFVRRAIEDVDVKSAVSVLIVGSFLLKYCHNTFRKPHQRLFWVDMENLTLNWLSPKKGPARTKIFLTDVDRIVPGVDSDFWRGKSEVERQFGIELLCQGRRLRIMCGQEDEWKTWLKGLLHAHQKALSKRKRAGSLTNDFIQKQWALADRDNNGSLSFYELIHLLQRLNCRADVRYAEQLFEQYDEDGSCVLEFNQFKLLFHKLLTHQDLMSCFEHYRDKKLHTITEDGFRRFLVEVQATPSHLLSEQVAEMRNLEEPFLKDEGLTDLGFNLLLTSEYNSLMNPSKRALNDQDMHAPLSHYWISSSHNTYLTGDQMIGKSAVGQYIEVLLRGCRCVELDCWDGPDGEPVIYHGHTLTSKIPFAAVIKACNDYGFQKSPYPVILSLEMHCSPRQKKRVGEILVEHLGSPGSPAPTPHSLKGLFLIKGRVPNEAGVEIEEGNEQDLLLQEEELQLDILSEFPVGYCFDLPQSIFNHTADDGPLTSGLAFKPSDSMEDNSSMKTTPSQRVDKGVPKQTYHSQKEDLKVFYDTLSLTGRRLVSFDKDRRGNMEICSLNERKFAKLSKLRPRDLSFFHQQFLSRVYPSGTRLMSSNFNPMLCWIHGAQMVALNFQALGLATLLNLGRFLENGNVGYVLKPQILRNPNQPFDPSSLDLQLLKAAHETPVELVIQVLAAQQLPRPFIDEKGNHRRDAVCPFVIVSIEGTRQDTTTRRTAFVMNNGLNPRWKDQKFAFDITVPSLAVIVFEVRHYDAVKTDFLAAAAAPVSTIRTGVRWVELYDSKLRPIHWSGLLVHVSIRPSTRLSQSNVLPSDINSDKLISDFLPPEIRSTKRANLYP